MDDFLRDNGESVLTAITALFTLVTAIVTFLIRKRVDRVASSVDGMKDELVAVTKREAFARGVEAAREPVRPPPSAPTGP